MQKVNRKRARQHIQKREKQKEDLALERAIARHTKAHQEWENEIENLKIAIFDKYKAKIDDSHPFLVDDYRMELVREMKRVDAFYRPLVRKEADVLRKKRELGLVHIEPEPFVLEGLDEIIPRINALIKNKKPQKQVQAKKPKQLLE